MLHIGGEHSLQYEIGDNEIQHHGSKAPYHPVEEGDVRCLGSQLTQEAHHNDIRRSANRGEHTTDRASIGRHQHQARGIFIGRKIDYLAIGSHHLADGLQQTKGDGEHHGSSCGITDPARAQHTCQTDGEEDAARRVAHPFHRHDTIGDALVKAVHHHTFSNQESTHEQEDHRAGKGRECIFHRHHAKDNAERRT